jgi:hypothetical protein
MRSRANSTTDFSFRFKDGAGITLVVMARMRKAVEAKSITVHRNTVGRRRN